VSDLDLHLQACANARALSRICDLLEGGSSPAVGRDGCATYQTLAPPSNLFSCASPDTPAEVIDFSNCPDPPYFWEL